MDTTDLSTETNMPTDSVIDSTQPSQIPDFTPEENCTFFNPANNNTSMTEPEQLPMPVFEVFIIIEIIMLVAELLLSFGLAAKLKQWRRNYRNQMLTQISVARFFKRIIGYAIFLEKKNKCLPDPSIVNLSLIIYINFVTIFLIFFLIKHMYDTLIVVFAKISKNDLYKVSLFSWLFPIPLTGAWVGLLECAVLERQLVDLIFCSLFKWTFTAIGTILYICILHEIIRDKSRKFAMKLAVITFLLCLTINLYIVCGDVSRLFRCFSLVMMKYVLGFILNCLFLCLYVLLISSNFSHRVKHCDAMSNHSVGAVNRELDLEVPQKYSVIYQSQNSQMINDDTS